MAELTEAEVLQYLNAKDDAIYGSWMDGFSLMVNTMKLCEGEDFFLDDPHWLKAEGYL